MTRFVLAVMFGLLARNAALAGEGSAAGLHVPDGFTIDRIAADPDVLFPMFACFDDRGRLFVAESSGLDLYAELKAQTRKCRIRLLEDPDENGRFRKSSVFADQLVFPMGLAWRDGKLYVADPPELITLEETNGNGKADKRTVILGGFGHLDNGSLHGLMFGPDGLLYMTMGQPDGYKFTRRDGKVVHGKNGALLRCRPDGSEPEVLCRGFENLVEIAFTPRGDVIGTVNWFQRPVGGLRDALVHLVPGGMYPLYEDRGTAEPVTGDFLPAAALFPAVALSGLERYRGRAFAGMQGQLFSAQHNARKVGRHVLEAHGATFRTQDFDFVTCASPDFHPSDVLEDADGALLVIDTGSWYVHHCPTGQIRKVHATGGIYRVRKVGAAPIADPRGLKIDWTKASTNRLVALLGDPRPVVQDRAQRSLIARGLPAIAPLAEAMAKGKDLVTRQHALWALARIEEEEALKALRVALADENSGIVVPAARALGLRRDREAASNLENLVQHKEVAVSLAAAEALARCGNAKSVPALLQALTRPDLDRFLEHGVIHALYYLADTKALAAALRASHPRVQQAALILLDQPPRPKNQLTPNQVIDRISSSDPDLRLTAVGILRRHAEWAEPARGLLRDWLQKPALSGGEEHSLRGVILAFHGAAKVQEMLAEVVADTRKSYSPERRLLVLETLADTSLPKAPASWITALDQAMQTDAPQKVRLQAVRTAAVLQLPQLDATLAKLGDQVDEAAELRLEALRAVVLRRPQINKANLQFLFDLLKDEERPLLRLAAGEVIGRAQLTEEQIKQVVETIVDNPLISPSVVLPALMPAKAHAADAAVAGYVEAAFRTGWRPSDQELKQLLTRFTDKLGDKARALLDLARQHAEKQKQRLFNYEELLTGGDVAKGRAVFFGKKTACATCHRVGNDGGKVGPDLTKIGAVRAGRDLLEAVVAPSSTIAQGFDPYVFVTDDGKVVNGLLARQTAEFVVVRDASGAEWQLRKARIQEMRRSTVSIMPEGLDRALSRAEFRDLLAFLQNLK